MNNGIYAIYFSGLYGNGAGTLVLKDGVITGADVTGTTIDGNYRVEKDSIVGKLELNSPAGTVLVTGASQGSEPGVWPIPFNFPLDLGGGNPISLKTPTGPINVIFKKLRDL